MKKLLDRVKKKLAVVAKKHKLTQKVQRAILKKLRKDQLLPSILEDRGSGIQIKFIVNNDKDEDAIPSVFCFIGPRDWQWDKKTGELIGCGTTLG